LSATRPAISLALLFLAASCGGNARPPVTAAPGETRPPAAGAADAPRQTVKPAEPSQPTTQETRHPERCEITVGGLKVTVEIAATIHERATGLSNRHEIGENEGMLFLFAKPRRLSFWMKDTHVPLSIAFITPEGEIAEIQDMEPLDESLHESAITVDKALEMPAGWFRRNGVKPGDTVKPPPELEGINPE
jgi:uncharacterized membrane protein (UPF0127 family)